MSNDQSCVLCGTQCDIYPAPLMHSVRDYRCRYCGPYLLNDVLISRDARFKDPKAKFVIACILNERRQKGLGGVAISDRTDLGNKVFTYPQVSVDDLIAEFPKTAGDFLNRTLLNLSRLPERPFDVIRLAVSNAHDRLQLFTLDVEGCYALLRELADQGLIRFNTVKERIQYDVFYLTAQFWEKVERLQEEAADNKNAFVAMWFDKSMDDYYADGFKRAIEDAGYRAIRIDALDFNDKICDEIISEIRRCKFLVSDFTGQRGGVYFEAGFAKGLGRPTIFTVKSSDVGQLHFDTRQYNHIVYDSPEDLRKKLYNRIRATIV